MNVFNVVRVIPRCSIPSLPRGIGTWRAILRYTQKNRFKKSFSSLRDVVFRDHVSTPSGTAVPCAFGVLFGLYLEARGGRIQKKQALLPL